jgi:hypothetical protein
MSGYPRDEIEAMVEKWLDATVEPRPKATGV